MDDRTPAAGPARLTERDLAAMERMIPCMSDQEQAALVAEVWLGADHHDRCPVLRRDALLGRDRASAGTEAT